MSGFFLEADAAGCRPLWLVTEQAADSWVERQTPAIAAWVRNNGFRGERHRVLTLPATNGDIAGAVLGLGKLADVARATPWHFAALPDRLPNGHYALAESLPTATATAAALGWALGNYRYERYRSHRGSPRTVLLAAPPGADMAHVQRLTEADALVRDLINTPAADLGPAELAAAIAGVANRFGARLNVIVGDELLTAGLPAIHAVGRAAAGAPRLVDLRWGNTGPRVTLVGKGVCFDTGGLDLKPSSGMLMMKKDMGGAACALGVAQLVMAAGLPVQLRLLIPAVENSVAGNAYRPGDVLATHKGISVEVNNTDAEGRLVLCDALALADEERPDLLIDFATLTGAARVALGAELPALYASDDTLSSELAKHGSLAADPMWPMPLWVGYEDELASKVADVSNVSASALAGSIIAALFLRRFVAETTPWVHLDLYAWNPKDRPGRPVGGEAQCVRAVFSWLAARFGVQPR